VAVEHHLPVTWCILDDEALGSIYDIQALAFGGRILGTTFSTQPDFAKLAEACGCYGENVTALEGVEDASVDAVTVAFGLRNKKLAEDKIKAAIGFAAGFLTYLIFGSGWIVRLLAAHPYFGAHAALPWLALGWALYGVYQVMIVITGRARATTRNVPAAALGLAVNVVLLLVLVPRSGANLGITGAALALCGAYIAMIAAMRVLTRSLFPVAFEWRRLAQAVAILSGVAVAGELLLSPSGAVGFVTRTLWLALIPALLVLTRFFTTRERVGARATLADARRRIAAARTPAAELEAYADDPLRDL